MKTKQNCKMLRVLAVLIFVGTLTTATLAAQYKFTTLDHPNAGSLTNAYEINNAGDVVGYYQPGIHGYVYNNGVWKDTIYPGGLDTNNQTINNAGWVGGYYYETESWPPPFHAYICNGATFDLQPYPGADKEGIHGINDAGETVGWAWLPGVQFLAYYHHGDVWDVLVAPEGGTVYPEDLNNSGQIVGACFARGNTCGFVFDSDNDSWAFFEHPDADGWTQFKGINEAGRIVGAYRTGDSWQTWEYHGFIFDGTEFVDFAVPWEATSNTLCHGLNDYGHIVGTYVTDADGHTHGFVAVPDYGTESIILTPTKDNYINRCGVSGSDTNYGGAEKLLVRSFDGVGCTLEEPKSARLIIQFDLPDVGLPVARATLGLYYYKKLGSIDPAGSVHEVRRLLNDWTEGIGLRPRTKGGTTLGSSWENRHNFGGSMAFPWGSHDLPHILDILPCEEGCSAWNYLGGGDFPYTDCNGTEHWGGDHVWATAVVPTTYGWMEWDVTVLVQKWNAGSFPNNGLVIRDIEEQWHSPCLYPDDNKFGAWFYSKEHIASEQEEGDYRPYLSVTYDLRSDPNDLGCEATW